MKDHASLMVQAIIERAKLQREYEPAALWVLGEALLWHGMEIKMVERTVRFHGIEEEDDTVSLIAIRHGNRLFDLWGSHDWETLARAQHLKRTKQWKGWSMESEEIALNDMPAMVANTLGPVKMRCSEAAIQAGGRAVAWMQANIIQDNTQIGGEAQTQARRL